MIDPNKENIGTTGRRELRALMIKYGIDNHPVDCFHVGPYRYANIDDAIAQARRMGLETDAENVSGPAP